MVHHYQRIVFSILIISVGLMSNLSAKDIPILQKVSIDIPLKEYSIVEFPFKIKDTQFGSFLYKSKRKVVVPIEEEADNATTKNKISLSKKKTENKEKVISKKGNILGVKKGINLLIFKPKIKGSIEVIIWGYSEFPIILNLNVVDKDEGDKTIRFIEPISKDKDVVKFESSSHEKIIENITRHLYDDNYKSKPSGYENVVRSDEYSINILDEDKKPFAVVKCTLVREILGRSYVGQVWNVDIEAIEKTSSFWGTDTSVQVPENFKLSLYDEMFDSDGVYSISLETYRITKEHGTRVMIVRANR